MIAKVAVGAAYERGRAAWPAIAVELELFERHVARLELAHEPHADLYLACACAHADPIALAEFDRTLLSQTATHIRRIDRSGELVEEVRQLLRERLLLARGDAPARIAEYSATGPLAAWLRVAAVRVAIDVQRRRGLEPAANETIQLVADDVGPEVALIRARYQTEYEVALRESLAELSPRQRNLVRMHFVDGMPVEKIGTSYAVHRATAARWIVEVKRQLLDATYRRLGVRLQLSPSEFASLTAAVRSQLHVSLNGLFAAAQ